VDQFRKIIRRFCCRTRRFCLIDHVACAAAVGSRDRCSGRYRLGASQIMTG